MNSIYAKAITFLIIAAIIVLGINGVLFQNNRSIQQAADRSVNAATEEFGRLRAQDELAHQRELQTLRSRIENVNSASRDRVVALDQKQRRDTAALVRRISTMPDQEVGEPVAAVLDQSRTRWPQ